MPWYNEFRYKNQRERLNWQFNRRIVIWPSGVITRQWNFGCLEGESGDEKNIVRRANAGIPKVYDYSAVRSNSYCYFQPRVVGTLGRPVCPHDICNSILSPGSGVAMSFQYQASLYQSSQNCDRSRVTPQTRL